MNKLDKQYTELLETILEHGVEKKDRTGTGTKSIFGYTIRHNMADGFPLLTTKKMAWKSIVVELLWFLKGETNIRYLVDNGCSIWNGDAYKNYSVNNFGKTIHTEEQFIQRIKSDDEFAKKWGDLGPIYGCQWRNWGPRSNETNYKLAGQKYHDQVADLIDQLKTNPDSRRLIVNAWNVGDLEKMVLPPCHYGFQVYTREMSPEERQKICPVYTKDSYGIGGKLTSPITIDWGKTPKRAISLMWNQRSVDTFLGLPFNIASYGLLLTIIAKEVNMVPDQLIGQLGDTHLYLNHIDQAKEQIGRELSYQERYDYWFAHNYETGIEKNYEIVPDFDNSYYDYTPTRTREPLPLSKLTINDTKDNQTIFTKLLPEKGDEEFYEYSDFILSNYKSHSPIKAPLSN